MADPGECGVGDGDQRLVARECIERLSAHPRRARCVLIVRDGHRRLRKLHGRRMDEVANEPEFFEGLENAVFEALAEELEE